MVSSSTNLRRWETLSATSDGPLLDDPRTSLRSHCSRPCGQRGRERRGEGNGAYSIQLRQRGRGMELKRLHWTEHTVETEGEGNGAKETSLDRAYS